MYVGVGSFIREVELFVDCFLMVVWCNFYGYIMVKCVCYGLCNILWCVVLWAFYIVYVYVFYWC